MAWSGIMTGLSVVGLLNAVAPRRRVRRIAGQAYGAGRRHRADIYVPLAARAPLPVVVFFYGGGWEEGAREDYRFVGAELAATGMVTVVPDYRLYPEVDHRGFLADAAMATRWARAVAVVHGGDPDRLFVAGHSAGAYLAAMVALDERLAAGPIAGVIGLAGPYDFEPDTPSRRAMFPGGGALRDCMPVAHVSATAPPMLLVAGRQDRVVAPDNTRRLAAALRARRREVVERYYPLAGHRLVLGAVAWPLRPAAPVLADIRRFIAASGRRA